VSLYRLYGDLPFTEKALRSAVSALELLEPRSLAEALRLMKRRGPATPIAGGTDLYVHLNAGTLEPRRFLNLGGLDEQRRIEVKRGVLSIGALATFSDCQRSALVRRRLPMLAAAAREVGGVQIQNRGTLGGNIANASPAGDALPVLAAAEALVVLRSAEGGSRRVAFNAFYTGYRASVLRADELIVALEIPPVPGKQWFRKVGTRFAQAISKVVIAAVRDREGNGPPRVALGSVGPTVMRASKTEAALAAGASVDEARAVLEAEIQPIDDLRSSAGYRRRVAGNLLRRFWEETA
jgi:xanthine dehydrogenase small subunit